MKSWMHVIEEYVLDRDDPLVSIDDLRKHLITLTLKPTVNCLRLVLTNMMLHGEIMSESQFAQKFGCKKDGDSSGWLTWGVSGVRKMLSWGTATQTGEFL